MDPTNIFLSIVLIGMVVYAIQPNKPNVNPLPTPFLPPNVNPLPTPFLPKPSVNPLPTPFLPKPSVNPVPQPHKVPFSPANIRPKPKSCPSGYFFSAAMNDCSPRFQN